MPRKPLRRLSRAGGWPVERVLLDCQIVASEHHGAGGEIGDDAHWALGRHYWMIGRHDLYRQQLRRQAERESDPSEALRLLWEADHVALPVEGMRDAMEQARRVAPDDDRVWLATANLATRSGRLDEAGACSIAASGHNRRTSLSSLHGSIGPRPADGPTTLCTAAHVPATGILPRPGAGAERVAGRGTRKSSGRAIGPRRALINLEPNQTAALERLADLAAQDGKSERVAEARRRKAAADARAIATMCSSTARICPRTRPSSAVPPARSIGSSMPGFGGRLPPG